MIISKITSSNPFPFLLWIATVFVAIESASQISSNPFPFLLWIATLSIILIIQRRISSNPFPFLLWIATHRWSYSLLGKIRVVTLFHFYCGLRQSNYYHRPFITKW